MMNETTITTILSKWKPEGKASLTMTLPESAWKLHVTAERCDEMSAQYWELRLQRDGEDHEQTMDKWAEQVSGKQIGLLEILKTLEIDSDRGETLLRSEAPTKRNDSLFYYELVLQGNKAATLRRFKGNYEAGSKREQMPFVLTHEVVEQLCQEVMF